MKIDNTTRYVVDPETGCWNWTGPIFVTTGYGQWSTGGVAHRRMYVLHRGPVPEGMEPDHTCRNRKCVNPWHLECVPHVINAQRGDKAKLSPDQVESMRRRHADGERVSALAIEFGIERGYAYRVISGKRWANIASVPQQRPDHRNTIPQIVVEAVLADSRLGLSTRKIAARHGIGKSAAHKIIATAREESSALPV